MLMSFRRRNCHSRSRRSDAAELHQACRRLGLRHPLRIGFELLFATRTAKVKLLPVMFGLTASLVRLNPHPADGILDFSGGRLVVADHTIFAGFQILVRIGGELLLATMAAKVILLAA